MNTPVEIRSDLTATGEVKLTFTDGDAEVEFMSLALTDVQLVALIQGHGAIATGKIINLEHIGKVREHKLVEVPSPPGMTASTAVAIWGCPEGWELVPGIMYTWGDRYMGEGGKRYVEVQIRGVL
jgi:hypothetical protein